MDDGWQPIETAPKERGVRVALLIDGEAHVGWWEIFPRHEPGWYNELADEYAAGPLQPTHWFPFPPLPPKDIAQ